MDYCPGKMRSTYQKLGGWEAHEGKTNILLYSDVAVILVVFQVSPEVVVVVVLVDVVVLVVVLVSQSKISLTKPVL